MFLVTGLFGGLFASVASAATPPACTTTSTAICAVDLNMTSGGFGVHGNTPQSLPGPASLTGTLNPATGAITDATLSQLKYHLSPSHVNTTTTETIWVTQITPGAGAGAINYKGDVSYQAALQVKITGPVTCIFPPIDISLNSSSPYAAGSVTIGSTTFGITNATLTTCGLGNGIINPRFAGPTGNNLFVTLAGALPLPPAPAKPTTTSLTANPPTQALAGTTVTLTASVLATGTAATDATGKVTFMSGGTVLQTVAVSSGTATFTTSKLPAKPDQALTAVYSGDGKYASSTSTPVTYSVQPKPGVSTNLPVTAIQGTSTPTPFTVKVTNPSTGADWPNVRVALALSGLNGEHLTKVTLTYEHTTGAWCPVSLSRNGEFRGAAEGLTGACGSTKSFPLAPGASVTIPLRIEYAPSGAGSNVGYQEVQVSLETVNGTGTPVAPFTTKFTTAYGRPTYAPYANGTVYINPATKYSMSFLKIAPTTTVPQGYQASPNITSDYPETLPYFTTTTTIYAPTPLNSNPSNLNRITFLVTGHTVTPPAVNIPAHNAYTVEFSTKGLSVGAHTLTAISSGTGVYNGITVTNTFTVIPANLGTSLTCVVASGTPVGSVVASGGVSLLTTAGPAAVSPLNVTLHVQTTDGLAETTGKAENLKISFTPGGSATGPTIDLSSADHTLTAGWSGLSGTVPVTASPGTVIPVGISSISFTAVSGTRTVPVVCTAPQPVSLGTAVVPGVALAASPTGPVTPGTVVTLKATAVPVTGIGVSGRVTFFDGSTNLGSATVVTSGPTKGIATLTVRPALGAHSFSAKWSATLPASVSNAVAFSVDTAPVVTKQPAPPTATLGQPLTFTAVATGSPVPTTTWQQSTDGGSTWTPAAGTVTSKTTGTTVTSTLTISSATKTDGNTKYRAVFTNSAPSGTATTNVVTPVVVIPIGVTTQPANQSVAAGSTASFTAAASGTAILVQWQASTDGGKSWSNAPGTPKTTYPISGTGVTSTYTTPATTTASNGTEYRVHLSNGAGAVTSNAATLTVTSTPPPPAPPAPPVTSSGYRLVAANGAVYSYGTVPFYGSMGGESLSAPIVGTASTPGDGGYWLVGSDGGIFSFGNAQFYGSMGGQPLNKPIVGMAATPTGGGYWLVASDGGIFAFGNAKFYGSTGGMTLNKPIVGMAATPTGGGYWEVASDGGIFSFGNAKFYGSTGSLTLNKPIVSMAATPTGGGYWLVASDGGIFSFGDAQFHGTVAGTTTSSIVGMEVSPTGGGYWETASNGQIFQFGDATSAGTAVSQGATIVAMSD